MWQTDGRTELRWLRRAIAVPAVARKNSTERNLDVASSVRLQPTQLLSWGHGGTLKTRDWKTWDWKTRDLKSMESLTKHKCSNNVERESKATSQKYQRGSARCTYRACAMWQPALLWDVRRGGTSGSWLFHLPHGHSDDPAFVLTYVTMCCICDKLNWMTLSVPLLYLFFYALFYMLILRLDSFITKYTWNKYHLVCMYM